jgi:hypothetical protein
MPVSRPILLWLIVVLVCRGWSIGPLLVPILRAEVDFDSQIRPLLAEHCFACHGPDEGQRKAKLRLDTREGLLGTGDQTGPFVPFRVDQSSAMARILTKDTDDLMPPPEANLALSHEQIQLLKQWVNEGADWKQHWAFEPIQRPEVPVPAAQAWVRNEIDGFILGRLAKLDLTPSPEASREELIRRLSLDLLGLPPTPEAVASFVSDPRPDAYDRLLDQLFSSPRYGERMVWDWLDAARYADSNGYQADRERTMWPWRDWAVAAFNENIPFDQLTIEQLAGDLLPHPTQSQILATGFNRNHMINGEGGRIPEENRVDYVMDMAETVGTVWLGLTFNCCRCHDHKFDPLTQRDYYGLFAFFNQTPVNGGGGDPQTPPILEVPSEDELASRQRLTQRLIDLETTARQLERELLNTGAQIPESIGPILDKDLSDRKDDGLTKLIEFSRETHPVYAQTLGAYQKMRTQRNQLNRRIPKVMVMRDRPEKRETRMLNRGLYNQALDVVEAATPGALPPMPEDSRRNRLGLARWLVSDQNPLTSRVFVNRQWALFFGQGLVATPEDFGTQGKRPSHPELLDWLADEFKRTGWNIKRLQRLIVSSATYRQSSRVSEARLAVDAGNEWLSRGSRYRLPSWMIRDQALAASGLLVDAMGGPAVQPYQPDGVWSDFTFGKKTYQQDHGAALYRRSLYTFWRRIIGPTMFFDAAKRQTCIVKASRTNTPLHALATLNDVTYVEAARALAELVMIDRDSDRGRIELAFQRTLGRAPRELELQVLSERLQSSRAVFSQDPESAAALLAQGEYPVNTTLNPIEQAALTTVFSLLFNLDETLSKQ